MFNLKYLSLATLRDMEKMTDSDYKSRCKIRREKMDDTGLPSIFQVGHNKEAVRDELRRRKRMVRDLTDSNLKRTDFNPWRPDNEG